jgi:hypothetical protein
VRVVSRIVAGVAGLALSALALMGVAFIGFTALVDLQLPDPDARLDGDPCCRYPDTWADVHEGIAWMFGEAVLESLIVCAAITAFAWALLGRRPRWRWLAVVPVGAVATAAIVTAPWWLPSSSRPVRERVISLIGPGTVSGVAIGASPGAVRAALGEPDDVSLTPPPVWTYDQLELAFRDGHVARLVLHARGAEWTREDVKRLLDERFISRHVDPKLTSDWQTAVRTSDGTLVMFGAEGTLDAVVVAEHSERGPVGAWCSSCPSSR